MTRPRKEKAPPAAETGAPTKSNVVSLPRVNKPGRTRYVRLFPERVHLALEALQLTPAEVVAWLRLLTAYGFADGWLEADDKQLARITKTGRRWPALRDKLIAAGLGRIEAGRWIDDDQDASLVIQRRAHTRGVRGAARRWGGRDA